jgi:hypothetical protein
MKHLTSLAILFVLLLTGASISQWNSNPLLNASLCPAGGRQSAPVVINDGSGGVIAAWVDERVLNESKIFVQKFNSLGMPQWQANGVALIPGQTNVFDLQAIPDGNGGAVLCWKESRSGTVAMYYARRINSSGVPQWSSEVGVTGPYDAANNDEKGKIAPDGNGGILITYKRYNNAVSKFEIHCQVISSDGTRYFGSNGAVAATSALSVSFENPKICPDGSGGVIVVYERNSRIYAQSLNNLGQKQWGSEGFDVFGSTVGSMYMPVICPDGVGGAIMTCLDQRVPANNFDIYAQRVKNGSVMWGLAGKPIAVGTARQWVQQIAYDNNFGAYIAWQDERESADSSKAYLQRIDLAGNMYFQNNGIRVNPYTCGLSSLTCGDSSAAYVVIASGSTYPDFCLYAQKISSLGTFPWNTAAIPVSTFLSVKNYTPNSFTTDNSGGLVCVWDDDRNDTVKVFGHKLQASGLTGISLSAEIPAEYKLEQNYPNPFNPSTVISFSIPKEENVSLKVFNAAGMEMRTLVNGSLRVGEHSFRFDATGLSSGVYFYSLSTRGFSQTKKMILVK